MHDRTRGRAARAHDATPRASLGTTPGIGELLLVMLRSRARSRRPPPASSSDVCDPHIPVATETTAPVASPKDGGCFPKVTDRKLFVSSAKSTDPRRDKSIARIPRRPSGALLTHPFLAARQAVVALHQCRWLVKQPPSVGEATAPSFRSPSGCTDRTRPRVDAGKGPPYDRDSANLARRSSPHASVSFPSSSIAGV